MARLLLTVLLSLCVLLTFSSADVVELNPQNFDRIVNNPMKNVFVMFYAPWCGHCHHMMPAWEELGKNYNEKGSIIIARLDASTHRSTAAPYDVKGFPTLKLFTRGNKSGGLSYTGPREVQDFQYFLKANLGK